MFKHTFNALFAAWIATLVVAVASIPAIERILP